MSYTLKPSFSSLWWERKVKRCITGNDIDTISTPLIFSQILWGRKNWLQRHCQLQQQHTTFHISIEEFWSWLSHWVDCAAAPVAIDRLDFNRMKHFTNVYVLFTFFILELHNWILVVRLWLCNISSDLGQFYLGTIHWTTFSCQPVLTMSSCGKYWAG